MRRRAARAPEARPPADGTVVERAPCTIAASASRDAALEARSAVRWADDLRVPTLIVHAREDRRAPLAGATDLAERLRGAGVAVELAVYEHDDHGLFLHRDAWIARAIAWFAQHGAFGGRPVEQPAAP